MQDRSVAEAFFPRSIHRSHLLLASALPSRLPSFLYLIRALTYVIAALLAYCTALLSVSLARPHTP